MSLFYVFYVTVCYANYRKLRETEVLFKGLNRTNSCKTLEHSIFEVSHVERYGVGPCSKNKIAS
jgi:hypothetical protein